MISSQFVLIYTEFNIELCMVNNKLNMYNLGGMLMNRLVYMDWLRVLATIAVVTIHVAAGYVSTLDANNVSRWMAGNLFRINFTCQCSNFCND